MTGMDNSKHPIVRKPTPDDEQYIISLGELFQKTSLFSVSGWSNDKARYWVRTGIDENSDTFMRVVELDGNVIGLFLGYISEYFFSYEKIASDLVVFIHPDHRMNAYRPLKQMVREFEEWAKERGAIETCIATSSGTDGAGYKKFVLKQGYNEVGFVTKKRI